MNTGKVKKWFGDRGFGFIERDDGQPDVFVHLSQFPDGAPNIGDRVRFDIDTQSDRSGRPRAEKVTFV